MRKLISLFSLVLLMLTGCMNEASTASTTTTPATPATTQTTQVPDSLYPFMNNPRGNNTVWGYINQEGKEIIKPVYLGAEPFDKQGYAIVSTGSSIEDYKYGLIDQSGKYVLQPIYVHLSHFAQDLYTATTADGVKLIKATGEEVLSIKGGTIGELSNDLAVFTESDQSGYIDQTGKKVIPAQFKTANSFKEDKAVVVLSNGTYALINKKGEVINNFTFDQEKAGLQEFSEGLGAYFEKGSSQYGFVHENGNITVPAKFSSVSSFEHGLAVVELEFADNKVGLINTQGKFVVPAEYTSINSLKNGLWAVGKGREEVGYFSNAPQSYAIVNNTGQFLTDFIYDQVEPFEGDYAVAQVGVSTFFIDKTGKKAEQLPTFEGVGTATIMGEVISATIDDRLQYVKRDGKVIWRSQYRAELESGITVTEDMVRPNREYLAYYPVIGGMKDEAVQQKINDILTHKVTAPSNTDGTNSTYDFVVETKQKDLLVVQINGYFYTYGAAHGMPDLAYKHINLQTGALYQLKDLFKANSNYIDKINQQVKEQMKTKGESLGVFPEALETFQGISENQGFYIKDNMLHIYFAPYEVGPYAAGFITFPIPLDQLKDVVDTDGDFWKSFH